MQNKNSCELLGYYGGDKTHCLSAWTSTFAELDIEIPEDVENRIDVLFDFAASTKKKTPYELLEMLATAGHHTPMEKSLLHFMVDSEIASHIHMLKHRIGVCINGESARYKELKEDKYYLPEDWKGIQLSGDIYSDGDLFANIGEDWYDVLGRASRLTNSLYHWSMKDITPVLGRKRTKESSRFFKMYNSQVMVDISFNWRSFAWFQSLRNSDSAQLEIKLIAEEMLKLVQDIPGNPFELTLKAFGYEKPVVEEEVIPNPIWRVVCKKGFNYHGKPTASIRTHEYKKATEQGYWIELIALETGQTILLSPEQVVKEVVCVKGFKVGTPEEYQLFNYYLD